MFLPFSLFCLRKIPFLLLAHMLNNLKKTLNNCFHKIVCALSLGIPRPTQEPVWMAIKVTYEKHINTLLILKTTLLRELLYWLFNSQCLQQPNSYSLAFSHVRTETQHVTHMHVRLSFILTQASIHTFSFFPEQVRITALSVIVIIFGMVHRFSKLLKFVILLSFFFPIVNHSILHLYCKSQHAS